MSQDTKMKLARKKVELKSWVNTKVHNISVLFLIMTVLLTALATAGIRYGVFESKTIVIQSAHAGGYMAREESEYSAEIVDCTTGIEVYAPKYGAPKDLMYRIMMAESGNNPLVENKVSTATGCFQWILGSWRSYGKELWKDDFYRKNIYNPEDNVELAAWAIAKYGTSPWDASRSVWQD